MEELIKITTTKKGTKVVSARDLHTFLEIKTEVILWCKRMFEYGFTEEVDFIALNSERSNNQLIINNYICMDK